MENKKRGALTSRQERAIKQQQILEKKRQEKAEYNLGAEKENSAGKNYNNRAVVPPKEKKPISKEKEMKKQERKRKRESLRREGTTVSQWFLSLCWINIPVFGFIYLLFLAFGSSVSEDKKRYARGFLIYKLLVIFLAIVVIYILIQLGAGVVDQALSLVQ